MTQDRIIINFGINSHKTNLMLKNMAKIEIIKEEEANGDVWFHVYLHGRHQKSKSSIEEAMEVVEKIKLGFPKKTMVYTEKI